MKKLTKVDLAALIRDEMKYVLIIILAIMTSCNGQKKALEKSAVSSEMPSENPLVLLLRDNYSGAETSETLIIKDEKRLKSFFSKINITRKPGLPVPEIDFSKEMVIVYCSGFRNDNESPDLSLVKETEKEMIFRPVYGFPEKKSNFTASISPFCVYKLPLTDKEITFESEK